MIAIALQSGSNGNCIYVEGGGVRLLLDAGISGRQAEQRLAAFGRDIRDCDVIVLSHDHRDHARSVGIFQRKFDLPIFATEATLAAADRGGRLGRLGEVRTFRAGEALGFGGMTLRTLPTPHDGVDGVAFVVQEGSTRLGVLTDLGHVFDDLPQTLAELDGVFLESNYDPEMLAAGAYPPFLQDRIAGPRGHLCNREAADLLARSANGRLRWACLSHLSEQNNHPRLALETHRMVLGDRLFGLHVASRYEATGPFRL